MNDRALVMAFKAHKNQKRKGTDIPYIIHPIETAVILISNGENQDLIDAALLHDTLEDTTVTYQDIMDSFGERTAELVLSVTEPYKSGRAKLSEDEEVKSWKARKTHTIEYLKTAGRDTKLLLCADKLSNIRSIVSDYNEIGDKVWDRFNAPRESQLWYYQALAESLKDLQGIKMYDELMEKIKYLIKNA
ncbi:MAG: HD domain-containing protein [Bacillota bacterium]|nr:HD domain-containing protein [Bacillota bacterium]